MLWKGFIASALSKQDARDTVFDLFTGTVDKPTDDDNNQGEIKVNKLTAEKFKELSPEQRRKLYDDIVSKIIAGRRHESE